MLTFESCYGPHPPECQTKGIERWKHRKEGWIRGQLAMRERILDEMRSRVWETVSMSALESVIKQIQEMEPQ